MPKMIIQTDKGEIIDTVQFDALSPQHNVWGDQFLDGGIMSRVVDAFQQAYELEARGH